MHGPVLVSWLLVGVCGGIGGYCLARLRRAAPGQRQARALEAAMGLSMALMAWIMTGAPGPPAGLLVVVCGATTVAAALPLGLRARHRAHHLVEGGGMVYMALVMAGAVAGGHGAHAGHGGHGGDAGLSGVPVVTGALLAYFALHALHTAPRLLPAAGGRAGVARRGPRPRAHGGTAGTGATVGAAVGPEAVEDELAVACRLALGLGMVVMLLAM